MYVRIAYKVHPLKRLNSDFFSDRKTNPPQNISSKMKTATNLLTKLHNICKTIITLYISYEKKKKCV